MNSLFMKQGVKGHLSDSASKGSGFSLKTILGQVVIVIQRFVILECMLGFYFNQQILEGPGDGII